MLCVCGYGLSYGLIFVLVFVCLFSEAVLCDSGWPQIHCVARDNVDFYPSASASRVMIFELRLLCSESFRSVSTLCFPSIELVPVLFRRYHRSVLFVCFELPDLHPLNF